MLQGDQNRLKINSAKFTHIWCTNELFSHLIASIARLLAVLSTFLKVSSEECIDCKTSVHVIPLVAYPLQTMRNVLSCFALGGRIFLGGLHNLRPKSNLE